MGPDIKRGPLHFSLRALHPREVFRLHSVDSGSYNFVDLVDATLASTSRSTRTFMFDISLVIPPSDMVPPITFLASQFFAYCLTDMVGYLALLRSDSAMSEFLEQLKIRLVEAQKRHQLATQKLQQAQQEHMLATQDFGSWQNAVRVETLREQQEAAARTTVSPAAAPPAPDPVPESQPTEEINKTDSIREMFHRHPEGLRPTDIWRQLGTQLKHRAYLYSVLKRLKDKGEVIERRGKYFAKVVQKIEGGEKAGNAALVQ